MKVFWLPLLLLCLSSMLLSAAANTAIRPSIVNIGALFHANSTIGKVAKIAVQEAVNDVNSNSTILNGTKLNLILGDSVCSGFLGFIQGTSTSQKSFVFEPNGFPQSKCVWIFNLFSLVMSAVAAMQFMEKEVVAVIGPQSSVVTHIVSLVATELQVPMLSFAATDPTLTHFNSPFFIRTSNSDLYQMTAIADIVDYFGWREVIAVFIDDDYGRNGVAALDDALADRNCKIFYKAGLPPESDVTRSKVMDVLVHVAMLESRVIVLHVTSDIGQLVFSVARYLEMMGNGYAWISTDWLSSVVDSYSPLPPEMMNEMQGVIALRQHTPDSDAKRAFISRWKNITHGSLGLNAYGLYAYDSVWILAQALDEFLSQGGNISFSGDFKVRYLHASSLHLEAMHIFDGGQALLNNILQSDLMGLTGPLKFDSERSRVHPAYDIINLVGNGYLQVGYWSNYSGLSIVPPETLYHLPPNRSSSNQHLRNVIWPDGTTTKPRGWVFPNSGKQLKIGVPIRVSYKEFVSRVSGTNDMFKGFCIDVFQAAINLLPYPVPYQFAGFGDGIQNPNYTDLVDMIAAGVSVFL